MMTKRSGKNAKQGDRHDRPKPAAPRPTNQRRDGRRSRQREEFVLAEHQEEERRERERELRSEARYKAPQVWVDELRRFNAKWRRFL